MYYQILKHTADNKADVIALNLSAGNFGAKVILNKDFSVSSAEYFVNKGHKYLWDMLFNKKFATVRNVI